MSSASRHRSISLIADGILQVRGAANPLWSASDEGQEHGQGEAAECDESVQVGGPSLDPQARG